jgi:hypothetical protein
VSNLPKGYVLCDYHTSVPVTFMRRSLALRCFLSMSVILLCTQL